jgi:hypothetical protein
MTTVKLRDGYRRLWLISGLALASGLVSAFPVSTQAESTAQPLQLVGTIALGTCGVHSSAVDEGLDAIIVVRDNTCSPDNDFRMEAYSAATMRLVGAAELVYPSGGTELTQHLAIDPGRQWVFLPLGNGTNGIPSTIYAYSIGGLLASGGGRLAPAASFTLPSLAAQGATGSGGVAGIVPVQNPTGAVGDTTLIPTGESYDGHLDALEVMTATFPNGYFTPTSPTSAHGPEALDVYVSQISVSSGAVAWTEAVGQCEYTTTGAASQIGLVADDPIMVTHNGSASDVVAGCLASRMPGVSPSPSQSAECSSSSSLQLAGGSALSYVIPLDTTGSPKQGTITANLGRPNTCAGLADPTSGRLFWIGVPGPGGTGASTAGPTAVTFDAAHDAYVGAPTIGDPTMNSGHFAVAVSDGKLYSFGSAGVTAVNASSTPLGQGLVIPRVSPTSCPANRAWADSHLHLLIVQWYARCTDSYTAVPALSVYRDNVPALGSSSPPDPDIYTTEATGQSAANLTSQFNAHGEASGARVRIVGGTTGLLRGATFGLSQAPLNGPGTPSLEDQLSQLGGPFAPDFSNHELDLAQVKAADLDNYKASANATAAGVDDATGNTYSTSPASQPGQTWPFGITACDNTGQAQQSQSYGSDTSSSVTCSSNSATSADGKATSGPLGLSLTLANASQPAPLMPTNTSMPFSVGSEIAESHVFLDAQHGLTSTSAAYVRGVNLGVASIDSVSAVTTCVAAGQKGTAGCTYARSFGGVDIGSTHLGSCTDDGTGSGASGCQTILEALNGIDPGILVFASPGPDGRLDYFAGSPGGYQAVAQRELYKHLQDSVINYDDSVQIPALEILYVNDSFTSPSRLDIQLANVEVESHYGISLLPAGFSSTLTGALDPLSGVTGPPPNFVSSLATIPAASIAAADNAGSGVGGLFNRLFQHLLQGLAWLMRSPGAALAASLLLFMLGSPLFMAQRRRRLGLLEGTT